MFRGISSLNLDTKGRVAVPARYRDHLHTESDNRLVMTIDINDECLLLYMLSDWALIEKKLAALPSFNKATRRIQRLLIGHATEVELDAQGRLGVPAVLREYAQLEKKALLVGQGNKFELWSETLWQRGREVWLNDAQNNAECLPEDVMSLSL